ncbi:MAG: DUF5305 family protein [Cellulosilyticaceae bacterium]
MKVKMHKQIKNSLIVVLILIIAVGALSVWRTLKTEQTIEVEKTLYTYQVQGDSDYRVNLKPNILYKETYLGAGETYLAEFAKNIEVFFTYYIEGDQALAWQGDYKVESDLRAYYKDQDKKNIIWSKVDTLVPSTQIKKSDPKVQIDTKSVVDFTRANEFAAQVIEASKVNASVELEVRLVGSMNTEINGKKVQEPIFMSLIIPMQSGYFNVAEMGEVEETKSITETVVESIGVNRTGVIAGGAIIVVSILGIIFLVCFAEGTMEKDAHSKAIKKIIKEHGSRMVAVNQDIDRVSKNLCEVMKIEDLVTVADELQLPILYPYHEDENQISYFYIESQERLYMYRIKIAQAQSEEELEIDEGEENT